MTKHFNSVFTSHGQVTCCLFSNASVGTSNDDCLPVQSHTTAANSTCNPFSQQNQTCFWRSIISHILSFKSQGILHFVKVVYKDSENMKKSFWFRSGLEALLKSWLTVLIKSIRSIIQRAIFQCIAVFAVKTCIQIYNYMNLIFLCSGKKYIYDHTASELY